MQTIAYLGPPGTFSEEAAVAYGGTGASFLPLASIPAVVTAVETAGATVLPIRHYLVARESLSLPEIKVLHAHPQSLGQCRRFVERCLPGVATIAALSNS